MSAPSRARRSYSVSRYPQTTITTAAATTQPPPSIKYVPGRDSSTVHQQPKRKRGRPSTKIASCMSPKAARGDSQIQVEPCAISPVPSSPMSSLSNQTNDHHAIHPVIDYLGFEAEIGSTSLHQSHDNQIVHPVIDHLVIQAPGSKGVSSIHQPIGSITKMKVENVTLNEDDEYRRGDIIGGNMEPDQQGPDLNFSYGETAALTVENQPTKSMRVSSNIFPTSTQDLNIYNVNSSFKELLQSIDGSQPVTSTMESNIYDVNSNYAETLKSIFEKHGDIAKDCAFQSPYMRTSILEAICKPVQELHSKKLNQLDYALLNSYYMVVNDGESIKFNMKWFREILDEIKNVVDSLVESQKIVEKMEKLEDTKRDLGLKKIELEKLLSELETKESQLVLETLLVVEDMKRNKEDLECKFKHFQDMHLMDGLL